MSEPTENVQILRDSQGNAMFAVLPIAHYQALIHKKKKIEQGIPIEIVELAVINGWSAARAWRKFLNLTQAEVANRIGITQGSYAQLETKERIPKSSRGKIANALGIDELQLDF